MSWTTPPTFASGTVVTAANLNILSADLSYLKTGYDGVAFSGAKLYRTSSLSVTTATNTDVTWQSDYYDVGNYWSTGATLTIPSSAIPSGYSTAAFSVKGVFRFATNSAGSRLAYLVQNGSTVESFGAASVSGDYSYLSFSTDILAAASDTLKVQLYQSSGSTLSVDIAKLAVFRIGPVS